MQKRYGGKETVTTLDTPDGLWPSNVHVTSEHSKTVWWITSSSHLHSFPIFSNEQQQEMHMICSMAYERLQRLLRKCQDHLCCSKRVWNEDAECVTSRWEVITGSSKAADYVNFTGHSLLGHYIFCLCDTLTLGNDSRSVLSSNVH